MAPVILSSDKTHLSNFGGDKAAWPLYMSIANIAKNFRKKPSTNAMLLLGYLSADKLEEIFDDDERGLAQRRLFHDSMAIIMAPLKEAGRNGVETVCADGYKRKVFPILSSYICDHPEQCLVAGTMQSFCPICEVPSTERSALTRYPTRTQGRAIRAMRAKMRKKPYQRVVAGSIEEEELRDFDELGLHLVEPFWMGFPFIDTDTLFTPDILHQLHKGMFQTHLLRWVKERLTKDEIDRRFRSLPRYSGLRHFGKGISHISQMTGKEQKELEKVLMVIITSSPKIPKEASAAASALLNFIYLARFPVHTDSTLTQMQQALETFHANKQIFVKLGVVKDLNAIPKLHSMQHYIHSIRSKGAADGYSTETPERLHIDFAKKAYRASNKNSYILQMIRWLARQEAMNHQRSYLAWRHGYTSFIDGSSVDSASESRTTISSSWDLDEVDAEIDGREVEPGMPPRAARTSENETASATTTALASSGCQLAVECVSDIFTVTNPLEISSQEHRLAKKPTYSQQTLNQIEERHATDQLRWYFYQYMSSTWPEIYNTFDDEHSHFQVWTHSWIPLPKVRDVSQHAAWHKLQAYPSHERTTAIGKHEVPGRFDTGLVLFKDDGSHTGLQRKSSITFTI